jgi:DegV family protein with EDD domain
MSTNPQIAFVTDSTSDIPQELVEEFNIQVVPNIMVINGKSFEDGNGLSRDEFYRRLPGLKSVPTTATASSGTYEQLYEILLTSGANQVISIHAASQLSGIYNAASVAAASFGGRVQVYDSEQLSLGLGFQVLAVAESVARGVSPDHALEILREVRPRTRVIAMLDTLEYVRRSGRVSWARARLGNLLNIKPFIEVKAGKVLSIGEARTRQKGIQRLKELLTGMGSIERLAVLHTAAEADARQFWAEIKNQIPPSVRPLIVNITTIIGVHTGPNCLGLAAVTKS